MLDKPLCWQQFGLKLKCFASSCRAAPCRAALPLRRANPSLPFKFPATAVLCLAKIIQKPAGGGEMCVPWKG